MSDAFTLSCNDDRLPGLVCDVYEMEMRYFRTSGRLPENKRRSEAIKVSKKLKGHLGHRISGYWENFPSEVVSEHARLLEAYSKGQSEYYQVQREIITSWARTGLDISLMKIESRPIARKSS